ncbi:MAG: Do family serine endopeptidase [Pseudomonadota bacterium]
MKKLTLALTLIAAALAAAPVPAALPAAVDGEALPSLAPLVEEVSPAVVNIQVSGSSSRARNGDPLGDFFGRRQNSRPMRSAGSGVIIDADNGYILTNHHVIANAEEIIVTLVDERTINATVVGSDEGTDVAVLKVAEEDLTNLTDITFGDSDATRVGDFVIAIGNPFGLSHTVTSGIVSALGRSGISRDGYEDFIQTDASINPGNSGGALVNLNGELVGINSAIISSNGGNVGIGFAIPSNMARSIMRQLLDYGEVRRGLLGVVIDTVNPTNADALGLKNVTGALVQSISPGSAAERAGIEINDIITAVNGDKVDSAAELRNSIGLMRSGDAVTITALREGKVQTFNATLDEMSSGRIANAGEIRPGLRGATFADADDGAGVIVTAVTSDSPAAEADGSGGLRERDLITHVNREAISGVEDLRREVGDAGSRPMYLEIRRNGRRLLLKFSR